MEKHPAEVFEVNVDNCGVLRRILDYSKKTGWRSLIVLHTNNFEKLVKELAEYSKGDCLLVATSKHRLGNCTTEKSPMNIDEYLGLEFNSAIVASEGLMRPNVISSAGETVRAGGFLALVVPQRDEWDPGIGKGNYKRYLEHMIPRARLHLWIEIKSNRHRHCTVYSFKLSGEILRTPREPQEFKSHRGVPKKLISLSRTWSQAEGLERFARFLKGRQRTLFLTGNRGRGKSYLVGLGLALGIFWHVLGRAIITGPSLASTQSIFRGLLDGLRALGIIDQRGVKVRRRGTMPIRVTGPWFHVSYETPTDARGAPLVVIDEAAALGVARTRRIAWSSGKVVVTTTTQGYEGSGRVYQQLIESFLPRPMIIHKLMEPVRYLPGDPLEKWLYDVFLLDVEPEGPSEVKMDNLVYNEVSGEDLVHDYELLRKLYSILVLAHYRNTPDDLLAIFESEGYRIHYLSVNNEPIAVTLTVTETTGGDPKRNIALNRLLIYIDKIDELKAVRISRIAVLPWLQRRGIGTRLLEIIEEWAKKEDYDLVDTIFSRHDVIEFWAKNDYKFFYISPRYNKITGEKNIAAGKPLSERGLRSLEEGSREFRLRLVLTLNSIYRDLAAEKAVIILNSTHHHLKTFTLTNNQIKRLKDCIKGLIDVEQVWDAFYLLLVNKVVMNGISWIDDDKHRIYLVARVLQGKPQDEASEIAGIGIDDAYNELTRVCKRLASDYISKQEG